MECKGKPTPKIAEHKVRSETLQFRYLKGLVTQFFFLPDFHKEQSELRAVLLIDFGGPAPSRISVGVNTWKNMGVVEKRVAIFFFAFEKTRWGWRT